MYWLEKGTSTKPETVLGVEQQSILCAEQSPHCIRFMIYFAALYCCRLVLQGFIGRSNLNSMSRPQTRKTSYPPRLRCNIHCRLPKQHVPTVLVAGETPLPTTPLAPAVPLVSVTSKHQPSVILSRCPQVSFTHGDRTSSSTVTPALQTTWLCQMEARKCARDALRAAPYI